MGALSAISMLLPLTYTMHPVPAILMLAGIFYGSQYGGAIGAILLTFSGALTVSGWLDSEIGDSDAFSWTKLCCSPINTRTASYLIQIGRAHV